MAHEISPPSREKIEEQIEEHFHSRVARLESHIDRADGPDLMCKTAERETQLCNPWQ